MKSVALFLALWTGIAIGSTTTSVQRKLPNVDYSDLFASSKENSKHSKDGTDDAYYDYGYDEKYYDSAKKQMGGSTRAPRYRASGKGKGKGEKGGKGKKTKGKGSDYYDYSYDDHYDKSGSSQKTPAPKSPLKKTNPPHYHYPDPPRNPGGNGKGMSESKKGDKNGKRVHTHSPYKSPTSSPLQPPTRAPTAPTLNPPSPPTPTIPTPPTPTAPAPAPPTPTPPTPMLPSTPTTTTQPSGPGGSRRVDLEPFSLEYDITPLIIPPISDVEAVMAVTASFLQNSLQQSFPALSTFSLSYVDEDLDFPTYIIDYEAFVTVTDGTSKEALDVAVDSVFQGASLQSYLELIQALPRGNGFRVATGIRKIATPENRDTLNTQENSTQSNEGRLPVPLLAAAGGVSFLLIVLGVILHRREQAAMGEGGGGKHHTQDVRTVAGDTYAGDTYADTTCSTSKGTRDQVSTDGYSAPELDSPTRHYMISSSDSDGGYATDSGNEYEEAGDDEDEEEQGTSEKEENGNFLGDSKVERLIHGAFLSGKVDNVVQADVEEGSMHSSIRSAQDHASITSGETSIHLLEFTGSEDDDSHRGEEVSREACPQHYAAPGSFQIPSVEQTDAEDVPVIIGTSHSRASQQTQKDVTNGSTCSRNGIETAAYHSHHSRNGSSKSMRSSEQEALEESQSQRSSKSHGSRQSGEGLQNGARQGHDQDYNDRHGNGRHEKSRVASLIEKYS